MRKKLVQVKNNEVAKLDVGRKNFPPLFDSLQLSFNYTEFQNDYKIIMTTEVG